MMNIRTVSGRTVAYDDAGVGRPVVLSARLPAEPRNVEAASRGAQ